MKTIVIIFYLLLNSLAGLTQEKIWKEFSNFSGFCGSKLTLYNDSTYLYETGCEGNSNINIGRWGLNEKKYKFKPQSLKNLKLISEIKELPPNENSSSLSIQIVDYQNLPIENFSLAVTKIKENYSLISVDGYFHIIGGSNEKNWFTLNQKNSDKNGVVTFSKKNRNLIFVTLIQLTGSKKDINLDKFKSNSLQIKINAPRKSFFYPSTKWIEKLEEDLSKFTEINE
jgi:hypothetical protein